MDEILPSDVMNVPMETPDYADLEADTIEKRQRWRTDRRVHEPEWFITSAFFRGNHYIEFDERTQRLTQRKLPPERVRLKVNRFQAKMRARISKFVKSRPKAVIVPATTDYQDYMNAKATQKVLDYIWRKAKLEKKYKDAITSMALMGKSFWWYHWDPNELGRVQHVDPMTGMKSIEVVPVGGVKVEVGSAFEVLVADPGVGQIGQQPEIMRIKMRPVSEMRVRYPEYAEKIQASSGDESFFAYERQIASLNPHTYASSRKKDDKDEVLVTEHFLRPSPERPAGEYRVMVGDVMVKVVEELPYGFADMDNPYPVDEFVDVPLPHQFWSPTIAAQLVDVQKELNLLRSRVADNTRRMMMPKIIAARQHQLQRSQWTSESGEVVDYIAVPNIPPPQPWHPPSVHADVWRQIEMAVKDMDDISQIFPASEGKSGGATSGFQTNLLQEATDSVHAPDIREAEMAIESASYKLRRMVKQGFDVPRLINSIGRNYEPEIFEFVGDQVDEAADIVVEVGSGLPTLKAAKQDAVVNLYKMGLLGDPADPSVRGRALSMLEMGAADEGMDIAKTDENQARRENKSVMESGQVMDPEFWENHQVHYTEHTLLMKSPEWNGMDDQKKMIHIRHTVLHARFINPQAALQIAMEKGVQDVIPMIQGMLPPPQAPPGAPPPPQGGPPPGGPPPPQPPPPQG